MIPLDDPRVHDVPSTPKTVCSAGRGKRCGRTATYRFEGRDGAWCSVHAETVFRTLGAYVPPPPPVPITDPSTMLVGDAVYVNRGGQLHRGEIRTLSADHREAFVRLTAGSARTTAWFDTSTLYRD